MKIAICFSGAIRSFKYCYPSIFKYLIEPLNADVFLHAWSSGKKIDKNLQVRFKMKEDLCDPNYVLEKLCPKKYVIDEYNSMWEEKILQEANMTDVDFMIPHDIYIKTCESQPLAYKRWAHNAMGMYYKIMKCNELKCEYEKENNFKYDIVIRARLDFIWTTFVNIDDINFKNKSTIFTINDIYCSQYRNVPNNDRFFGGNSETMDKFCNIFKRLRKIYKKNIPIHGSELFVNEIKKYNYDRFGDDTYYYKFINKFHVKQKLLKKNKILITITDDLFYYIADYFLQNDYIVFGYNVDHKYYKKLSCYYNYNNISHMLPEDKYDYYIINDNCNLNEINNLKNFTLISSNKFNSNINTILIKCKIINKCDKKINLKNNECDINELSHFIYQYIKNDYNQSITIDGSHKCNLEENDIVLYDASFGIKTTICFKYIVISDKELKLTNNFHNRFLKGHRYKVAIINNYSLNKLKIINVNKYFKNNKIPSIFIN
jgi:hypothetical protein